MEDNIIKITKNFHAPIETVWDAFTNPESLKQWKSPTDMTTPDAQVDLQVGGSYSITMAGEQAGPTGKVTVKGEYETIEKPTLLVFSWQWEGQDEKTKIMVRLREVSATDTEMSFIHEGFIESASKENHAKGWDSTFEKLESFLK